MRRIVYLLAAGMIIAATTVTAARAQDPQPAKDAPATLSLTIRVTPANVWKVVGDLRQLMNEGPSSAAGPNMLRDLAGVIGASVALESGAASQAPASGIGVSSEPLTRAVQQGSVGAAMDAWTREQQRVGSQAADAGASRRLSEAAAGAAKALEVHAAAARQGLSAMAGELAALKKSWTPQSSPTPATPATPAPSSGQRR